MIDVYGSGSPNVMKVLFMLSEAGLAHRWHGVNVAAGEQFSASFTALNPNGKVPVIVDPHGPDGVPHTVFESGAILLYLAEKTGRFWPADPATRSTVLQWLMWQMAGVGPMFGQAMHFTYIAGPGNDYAKERYQREVNRLYDVAEARLSSSAWLGGAEFGIADMAAFPWLGKYPKTLSIDMGRRPSVQAWIDAVRARPAWQRIDEHTRALFKQGLAQQKEARTEQLDRFFGRAAAASS